MSSGLNARFAGVSFQACLWLSLLCGREGMPHRASGTSLSHTSTLGLLEYSRRTVRIPTPGSEGKHVSLARGLGSLNMGQRMCLPGSVLLTPTRHDCFCFSWHHGSLYPTFLYVSSVTRSREKRTYDQLSFFF